MTEEQREKARIRNRRYRARHKELLGIKEKERRSRPEYKETLRLYREANRLKINEYSCKWKRQKRLDDGINLRVLLTDEERRANRAKSCQKWVRENREKINHKRRLTRNKLKDKEWRINNRARHNESKRLSARRCRAKNLNAARERDRIASAKRNPEIKRQYLRRYAANNVERRRKYLAELRKSNPNHKLSVYLRTRIRMKLKRNPRCDSFVELIGTSIARLKTYLESQFRDGMTWENWSIKGWHIDHIKPIASFNLIDPEEQRRCFHYTNLQPLWSWENLTKHARIT